MPPTLEMKTPAESKSRLVQHALDSTPTAAHILSFLDPGSLLQLFQAGNSIFSNIFKGKYNNIHHRSFMEREYCSTALIDEARSLARIATQIDQDTETKVEPSELHYKARKMFRLLYKANFYIQYKPYDTLLKYNPLFQRHSRAFLEAHIGLRHQHYVGRYRISAGENLSAVFHSLESQDSHITGLNFKDIHVVSTAEIILLANSLKHPNCKIVEIYLNNKQIDIDGIRAIADALINPNSRLTRLSLNKTHLCPLGTVALADALNHQNCKLTSLYLCDNVVGARGVRALADAIIDPKCRLQFFRLARTGLADADLKPLRKACFIRRLIYNPNFRSLDFRTRIYGVANFFQDTSASQIKQFLTLSLTIGNLTALSQLLHYAKESDPRTIAKDFLEDNRTIRYLAQNTDNHALMKIIKEIDDPKCNDLLTNLSIFTISAESKDETTQQTTLGVA